MLSEGSLFSFYIIFFKFPLRKANLVCVTLNVQAFYIGKDKVGILFILAYFEHSLDVL